VALGGGGVRPGCVRAGAPVLLEREEDTAVVGGGGNARKEDAAVVAVAGPGRARTWRGTGREATTRG
jgi:hypothetical protein